MEYAPVTTAVTASTPEGPSLTLSHVRPRPTISVPVGTRFVVSVPPWHFGQSSELRITDTTVIRELSSDLLEGGGRRSILVAVSPGSAEISAGVKPVSRLMMPAFGGHVVVTAGSPA